MQPYTGTYENIREFIFACICLYCKKYMHIFQNLCLYLPIFIKIYTQYHELYICIQLSILYLPV